MQSLTAIQTAVFGIFTSYKAFARQEYLNRLGYSAEIVADTIAALVALGYLKRNKLGHLSVTVEAQRARHGGLTNAEYLDKARREDQAQRQADWNAAFGGRK